MSVSSAAAAKKRPRFRCQGQLFIRNSRIPPFDGLQAAGDRGNAELQTVEKRGISLGMIPLDAGLIAERPVGPRD